MKTFKIFVIVGEASGDRLAADLLENISKDEKIEIYGTGGKYLKNIGQKQYYSIDNLEIIGIDGLIKKSISLINIYNALLHKLVQINPDILLLVDYPGFNIRFAKAAKKKGFKTIYYVAPQVWAWGKRRLYKLKNCVDLLLCILPFEAKIFSTVGIKTLYTGNPIISKINYQYKTKSDLFDNISLDPSLYTIAILPGSRKKEIKNHMPIITEAMSQLKDLQFIICKSNEISHELIQKYVKVNKNIKITEGLTYDCLKYADFAWVCSGTATLETAIINTPMLIFYKTSLLTYFLAKLFLNIPYIGLPNIISCKKVVPELIGNKMTPNNIIQTFNNLKENTSIQVSYLKDIKEKLLVQNFDPIEYAGEVIKEFLKL
jgi:lipid-A-disaccharide synthase